MKNHYQTLGLAEGASQEEIRKAYRYYASKYHPDVHAGDTFFEDKFKEIREAYDILSNPDLREAYDQSLNPTYSYESEENAEFAGKGSRMPDEHSKNWIGILVIGIMVLLFGLGGIFILIKRLSSEDPTIVVQSDPTAGWDFNFNKKFIVKTPVKMTKQMAGDEEFAHQFPEDFAVHDEWRFRTKTHLGGLTHVEKEVSDFDHEAWLQTRLETFMNESDGEDLQLTFSTPNPQYDQINVTGTFTQNGRTGYVESFSIQRDGEIYTFYVFSDQTDRYIEQTKAMIKSIKLKS
ncbi:DnaJ domain-containing protein [Pontibacter sp. G13]|uniref:J domain-containing protein n=1 Tax=Pontibacter sp. G13 TaxID=3074898 RepID=UPI00288AC8B6|nr:DnaJ domain-containing protein [Pontibacter sp. G13]WNJ20144.1 DnaJ domain-containing protein [Pontibacter sp. G13]